MDRGLPLVLVPIAEPGCCGTFVLDGGVPVGVGGPAEGEDAGSNRPFRGSLRGSQVALRQAAATAGLLTGGKFNLGVGTGEALNEHVTGAKWPAAEERQEMLEEAVTIIAELFTGEQLTYHGPHYQVETARLYSVPRVPPPIYVSGFGEKSARLAARIADGYICMGPQADLIKLYRDEGGGDQPVQGGIKSCWAPDAGPPRKAMHRLWPNDSIPASPRSCSRCRGTSSSLPSW